MTAETTVPARPEAPSQARMVIGGESAASADGQTFDIVNPADGKTIATAALGGKEDVDRAVAAAQAAFDDRKGWANWAAGKRGRNLSKLADLIRQHTDELAWLESRNGGKPITSARGEVTGASLVFDYYAGAANKIFGQTIPVSKPGLDLTLREPIGVVGLIVPWNFPLLMASWKVAPALAAGNTALLKPASYTPLTAIRLGELALEAGIPPGVLNVVTGPGGTVGASIAAHPGIGKVAFTGETTTGQEIMRLASSNVKKISLELGGKSPNIVFADADLEKFARESPYSVFDNCGQDCCARSRIFVERSVHERVVELFAEATRGVKVGDPADEATEVGPLVSAKQRDRVKDYIEIGLGEGATVVVGNRARGPGPGRRGVSHAGGLRWRLERHADREGGDLRPGGLDHPVRRRSGGDSLGQRHALRPVRLRVEPRHRQGPAHREGHPGGRPLGELEQLGPHRGAVRRLQDVGHRARARHVGDRPVHRDQEHLHRPAVT
jgi:acyl-CoA reductase-like NAD-dependent aldehyde dehydrogenase